MSPRHATTCWPACAGSTRDTSTSAVARACRIRLGAADLDELTRQVVDVVTSGAITVIDARADVRRHLGHVAAALADAADPTANVAARGTRGS